jgi:hypothetical protein
MYHNAAWCFCYEVFLLYIIDYTVEYDQLLSIIKLGVTHTILLGVPGANHNPAVFLMLNKKYWQKQTTLPCGKNVLPCNMVDALWFL